MACGSFRLVMPRFMHLRQISPSDSRCQRRGLLTAIVGDGVHAASGLVSPSQCLAASADASDDRRACSYPGFARCFTQRPILRCSARISPVHGQRTAVRPHLQSRFPPREQQMQSSIHRHATRDRVVDRKHFEGANVRLTSSRVSHPADRRRRDRQARRARGGGAVTGRVRRRRGRGGSWQMISTNPMPPNSTTPRQRSLHERRRVLPKA